MYFPVLAHKTTVAIFTPVYKKLHLKTRLFKGQARHGFIESEYLTSETKYVQSSTRNYRILINWPCLVHRWRIAGDTPTTDDLALSDSLLCHKFVRPSWR